MTSPIEIVRRAWSTGEEPNLGHLLMDFQGSESEYAKHFQALLSTDAEERRARSVDPPRWDQLAKMPWRTGLDFEIVYERLRDSLARLENTVRTGNTDPLALNTYIPSRSSPHAQYYQWFLEYLVMCHKEARFATNPDSPYPNGADYYTLATSEEDRVTIDYAIRGINLVERDYTAVCLSLGNLTSKRTFPFRIGEWSAYDELGRGGQGVVYLVKDNMHIEYALKVPIWQAPQSGDEAMILSKRVKSFLEEAAKLHRFNHCVGIVQVAQVVCPPIHDHATVEETIARLRHHLQNKPLAIAMELAKGGSLKERMAKGMIPIKESLRIVRQLCEILIPMHSEGFTHRDINPKNILFDEQGNVKLTDFGLADHYNSITALNARAGTPLYRAPEQINPSLGDVQQLTDVWALGVLMYELVTGTHPFDGPNFGFNEIQQRILNNDPPPVRNFSNNFVPDSISNLIQKCLKKSSNDRPSVRETYETILGNLTDIDSENTKTDLFAWNPYIHTHPSTSLQLVILLVEAKSFSAELYAKLEDELRNCNCRTYRIYQVFGKYDLVIRAAVPLGQTKRLTLAVQNLPDIEHASTIEITAVLHHWYWGRKPKPQIGYDALSRINLELKKKGWQRSSIVKQAQEDGLLRIVRPDRSRNMFYVFFRNQSSDSKKEIERINLLSTAKRHATEKLTEASRIAVYATSDNNSFLGILKGETDNIYLLGELVAELNNRFKFLSCITMTCVVSDPVIRGSENLDEASFREIARPRDYVHSHFSEVAQLYGEGILTDDKLNMSLIGFLGSLDRLPQGDCKELLNTLDACLAAALERDAGRVKGIITQALYTAKTVLEACPVASPKSSLREKLSHATANLDGKDAANWLASTPWEEADELREFASVDYSGGLSLIEAALKLGEFLKDLVTLRMIMIGGASIDFSLDSSVGSNDDTTANWEKT